MKKQTTFLVCLLVTLFVCANLQAAAGQHKEHNQSNGSSSTATTQSGSQPDEDTLRFEGEKRYSANCGRCHQAPHKLSPRVMATAVRHMRVRATLTDEDMRYLLWYLTR